MELLQKLFSSISPEARLLAELAELTGRNQALANRLQRHAELCIYPQTKAVLEELARKEAAHVKALNAILADHKTWSKLPGPLHDGSNNWERIGHDLDLALEMELGLGRLATRWEGIDPGLSARLQALADEEGRVASELRKLALKADPQAID